MTHFTLYSRSYCHLCDDMLQHLQQQLLHLDQHNACTVTVIDVDVDEALVALYDELVPVLIGQKDEGETVQLCHYHLDVHALQTFLGAA